jgi:hypothetical protein
MRRRKAERYVYSPLSGWETIDVSQDDWAEGHLLCEIHVDIDQESSARVTLRI